MQVHYGRASLSPLRLLPAYFVFPRRSLDISVLAHQILQHAITVAEGSSKQAVVVILDQEYVWARDGLQAALVQKVHPLPMLK